MATLTVRNLPDEVIERLKEIAARNRRSMEQEVRTILESVSLDRVSACRRIEQAWTDQSRPTTAEEVDRWLALSRP
jgi:plasmid stability protein